MKTLKKLKTAQELIKANSNVMGGFNQFIFGSPPPKRGDYGSGDQWYSETQGYEYAKEMAKKGEIYFTWVFKCGVNTDCFPFMFGGVFVCNSCGRSNVDKDWWVIKVEKDGNEYCCHGLDFEDLQSSDNYAFGGTFEQSITNYGNKMSLNHL